jgi:hypothetical protein
MDIEYNLQTPHIAAAWAGAIGNKSDVLKEL